MFSCNKVNSIIIKTVQGQGYVAQELNQKGKLLERISGKFDDANIVAAFFKRMGYPAKNIHFNYELPTDTFTRVAML